jgi:hypothetical protein
MTNAEFYDLAQRVLVRTGADAVKYYCNKQLLEVYPDIYETILRIIQNIIGVGLHRIEEELLRDEAVSKGL